MDNVAKIMQGQRPGRLNVTGVQQIEVLAETLRDVHFDAVVSSDLQRSYDSAIILAARRTMSVATTPLLRERDWGDFTGRYILELKGLPICEVHKMSNAEYRILQL